MLSAVLLSWRRPYHIPTICRHLRQFPEIGEIIVWSNEHEPPPEFHIVADQVHWSETNQGTLGRFLGAMQAENELVFMQDDDLLVNNIPQLFRNTQESPSDIVANLVDDKSSRHWTWWQHHHPQWVELGFGSVFRREWAATLLEWPYDRTLLERKADKIFSVFYQWRAVKAGPAEITRLYHAGKESGRDENALWLRSDHERLTKEAVRLATEWKSARAGAADAVELREGGVVLQPVGGVAGMA